MTTLTTSTPVEKGSLPTPVIQGAVNLSRRVTLLNSLRRYWDDFKAHIGTGAALSSDSAPGEPDEVKEGYRLHLLDASSINEVIVDRDWAGDFKRSVSVTPEHRDNERGAGGSHPAHTGDTDKPSLAVDSFWDSWALLAMLKRRTWPVIMEIFSSRFVDEKAEWHFCQESWYLKKKLALWAALWLIANWVLGCIFIRHNPTSTLDRTFYFGIAPVLSLPVVFMVMYDWPRTRPYVYQSFLVVSVWCWSFFQIIAIISCGYYSETPHCQGKDFLPALYYITALQTIALFGLRLNRFPATLAAVTFFLFTSITIIPKRTSWTQTVINIFIFQAFVIYVHYVGERCERRLYNLRAQLVKVQFLFKAKQKAQLDERCAWASRQQLASCVRLPLNTALLTVQNMGASGAISDEQQLQFDALCGSLNMMSKLLDDVLNFDHIDTSKFELMNHPYAFHEVVKSLFAPLEQTTKARGLTFEAELDPNIDILARQASYKAMGAKSEAILRHIKEHPDVNGIVLGDEVRLRQIITNLTSNACKFTPAGGKLIIRTKLVTPSVPDGFDTLGDFRDTGDYCSFDATRAAELDKQEPDRQFEDVETNTRTLSHGYLTLHSIEHGDKPQEVLETFVVRIEVEDTGCGIKPRDIYVGKPFSDSKQTEQGRQQGEKSTGLSLALVQRLVTISGGRLGVRSKEGQGSTFWVELPVGVGKKTFLTDPKITSRKLSTAPSSRNAPTSRPSRQRMHPLQDTEYDLVTVSNEPSPRGLGLKQVPPADPQTSAVMQGMVEQGEQVYLALRQRSMSRHHDAALSSAKLAAPILLPPHMMPAVAPSIPLYEYVDPGGACADLQADIQSSTSMNADERRKAGLGSEPSAPQLLE